MDSNTSTTIYFKNNMWNYITKEVDTRTYQVTYAEKCGFDTFEQAERNYEQDQRIFKQSMQKLKKATGYEFTFSGYLDYWFQHILTSYAYGTYQYGCAWVIYNLVIPTIEQDVLLNMVNTAYINRILKNCSPACESAGHMVRKVLNIAMKDAVADGYLQTNPVVNSDTYKEIVPKIVIYSKPQIKQLLQASCQYHSIYLEVLLGLFCGLRPGEIRGLKYSDFDFKEKTVTIARQITRDYTVTVDKADKENTLKIQSKSGTPKPPKSYSSYRTLRVPDVIIREVLDRKKENSELSKRARVFDTNYQEYISLGPNGHVKSDGTVLCALKRICRNNSLPVITGHGLRHLYASILIEQGVPLEKISKLMGHRDVATTFQVYCGIIHAKEQIRDYVEENLNPLNAAYRKLTDRG